MIAPPPRHASGLWRRALAVAVGILAVIGAGVAIERCRSVLDVLGGSPAPAAGSYEASFAERPIVTLLHVLPGLVFMVLGPFQFVPGLRAKYLSAHRWSGRILVGAGVVAGITALVLAFRAFGGPLETAATAVFAPFFLFSLGKAWRHIRRREVAAHREWMIRAFAIGLAVASMRPLGGLAMVTTGRPLADVLGVVFWLAFLLHWLVAEVWIRRSRGGARSGRLLSPPERP